MIYPLDAEWLEADGLGGFASGTVSGVRSRRYHALLLNSLTPPTGREVLVNGYDAWVQTASGRFPISTQRYSPNTLYPEGQSFLVSFENDPWPTWIYRFPDGSQIRQELFVPRGQSAVVVSWAFEGKGEATLNLRPLLSGRDYHALHHENPDLNASFETSGNSVSWQTYAGIPRVYAQSNAAYRHDPLWFRQFLYTQERDRGLDAVEDLWSPGDFQWSLSQHEAVLIFRADRRPNEVAEPLEVAHRLRENEESRRATFLTPLHRSADAYLVQRGSGKTIIAGYPWFTDWGRDTFIAMRGLCLTTGRLDVAGKILLAWAGTVSQGMLPNFFPDGGDVPEYNSVDASLWYIIAVDAYWKACERAAQPASAFHRDALQVAIETILRGYRSGTRYGIRMDQDSALLCAGAPGVALTWMDARVDGTPMTGRIGKPVEIQALWASALLVASGFSSEWSAPYQRMRESFKSRFWNAQQQCLYDVVDVNHQSGALDGTSRPNQIFAVGGLPCALLDGQRGRQIVDRVEADLWTPMGLRTLGPKEPNYRGRYEGDARARDKIYHQGAAWPWLVGAFVDAWLNVHGRTDENKRAARERFVKPLMHRLGEGGIGHVSELADGDAPHTPRGCPFQAWSLGELLFAEQLTSETKVGDLG